MLTPISQKTPGGREVGAFYGMHSLYGGWLWLARRPLRVFGIYLGLLGEERIGADSLRLGTRTVAMNGLLFAYSRLSSVFYT